jgi:hypothetical protein
MQFLAFASSGFACAAWVAKASARDTTAISMLFI